MSDSSKRRAATRAARDRQRKTGEPYTEAKRLSAAEAGGERPPAITVTTIEITHPQGFGGHEFEYQPSDDLFRCVHCGGFEFILRDGETGEIGPCRAIGTATAEAIDHTSGGGKRWQVTFPDRQSGQLATHGVSWRSTVAWDDRACLTEQISLVLKPYGWRVIGWPEQITETITLSLARNESGRHWDDVYELYRRASGIDFHEAHHAYINAVGHALLAAGVAVVDWDGGGDEPRGGYIQLGAATPEEDDDEDEDERDNSETCLMWREDRGWYEVWFSDRRNALGDTATDLDVPILATPDHMVRAFREHFGDQFGQVKDIPAWPAPPGYDDNPELSDDGTGKWWDVSVEFERSLTAYADKAQGS